MNTAICERGFLVLNLIKDDLRNCIRIFPEFIFIFLGDKNLEHAMRIEIEGIQVNQFEFIAAYAKWNEVAQRRFI